jgi:dTDP-4-amino-4,6-dideoxygalactose transaminase
MSEWKHQKAGSIGDFGCFSLQNTKTITCGEGGAIIGNDDKMMDLAHSFHNFGRPRGPHMKKGKYGHPNVGTKCRTTEIEASILTTQMDTSNQEISRREENAKYLAGKLGEIPGIVLRQEYEGTTRVSYHYFGFRYKAEHFDGLSRDKFVKAMGAEGIPLSTGLGNIEGVSQNREGCIEAALNSKTYKAIYSKRRLADYRDGLSCPVGEQLVEEIVGIYHPVLLGSKKDMDDIADAVTKIYENRKNLVKA